MPANKYSARIGANNRKKVEDYFLYNELTTFRAAGRAIGLSNVTVKKWYDFLFNKKL